MASRGQQTPYTQTSPTAKATDRFGGLGYNPLLDVHLTPFLTTKRMFTHLRQVGLVNSQGEVADQEQYRLTHYRREHKYRVTEELTDALTERIIEQRRLAEVATQRAMEERARRERVERIKIQRDHNTHTYLQNAVDATLYQIKSHIQREPDTELFEEVGNDKVRKRDDEQFAFTVSGRSRKAPSQANRTKTAPKRRLVRKKATDEGPLVTLQYIGSQSLPTGPCMDTTVRITVHQQFDASANKIVFDHKAVPIGRHFSFRSLRKPDAKFAVTIFVNGQNLARISTCCEQKHHPGAWIAGHKIGLRFVSVEDGIPCMRCQVEAFVESQPMTGEHAAPRRRSSEADASSEIQSPLSLSTSSPIDAVHPIRSAPLPAGDLASSSSAFVRIADSKPQDASTSRPASAHRHEMRHPEYPTAPTDRAPVALKSPEPVVVSTAFTPAGAIAPSTSKVTEPQPQPQMQLQPQLSVDLVHPSEVAPLLHVDPTPAATLHVASPPPTVHAPQPPAMPRESSNGATSAGPLQAKKRYDEVHREQAIAEPNVHALQQPMPRPPSQPPNPSKPTRPQSHRAPDSHATNITSNSVQPEVVSERPKSRVQIVHERDLPKPELLEQETQTVESTKPLHINAVATLSGDHIQEKPLPTSNEHSTLKAAGHGVTSLLATVSVLSSAPAAIAAPLVPEPPQHNPKPRASTDSYAADEFETSSDDGDHKDDGNEDDDDEDNDEDKELAAHAGDKQKVAAEAQHMSNPASLSSSDSSEELEAASALTTHSSQSSSVHSADDDRLHTEHNTEQKGPSPVAQDSKRASTSSDESESIISSSSSEDEADDLELSADPIAVGSVPSHASNSKVLRTEAPRAQVEKTEKSVVVGANSLAKNEVAEATAAIEANEATTAVSPTVVSQETSEIFELQQPSARRSVSFSAESSIISTAEDSLGDHSDTKDISSPVQSASPELDQEASSTPMRKGSKQLRSPPPVELPEAAMPIHATPSRSDSGDSEHVSAPSSPNPNRLSPPAALATALPLSPILHAPKPPEDVPSSSGRSRFASIDRSNRRVSFANAPNYSPASEAIRKLSLPSAVVVGNLRQHSSQANAHSHEDVAPRTSSPIEHMRDSAQDAMDSVAHNTKHLAASAKQISAVTDIAALSKPAMTFDTHSVTISADVSLEEMAFPAKEVHKYEHALLHLGSADLSLSASFDLDEPDFETPVATASNTTTEVADATENTVHWLADTVHEVVHVSAITKKFTEAVVDDAVTGLAATSSALLSAVPADSASNRLSQLSFDLSDIEDELKTQVLNVSVALDAVAPKSVLPTQLAEADVSIEEPSFDLAMQDSLDASVDLQAPKLVLELNSQPITMQLADDIEVHESVQPSTPRNAKPDNHAAENSQSQDSESLVGEVDEATTNNASEASSDMPSASAVNGTEDKEEEDLDSSSEQSNVDNDTLVPVKLRRQSDSDSDMLDDDLTVESIGRKSADAEASDDDDDDAF